MTYERVPTAQGLQALLDVAQLQGRVVRWRPQYSRYIVTDESTDWRKPNHTWAVSDDERGVNNLTSLLESNANR